jgi:hypothetical protein
VATSDLGLEANTIGMLAFTSVGALFLGLGLLENLLIINHESSVDCIRSSYHGIMSTLMRIAAQMLDGRSNLAYCNLSSTPSSDTRVFASSITHNCMHIGSSTCGLNRLLIFIESILLFIEKVRLSCLSFAIPSRHLSILDSI